MLRNPLLDLAHAIKRLVPAPLELSGDQSVLRIRRIKLALSAVCRVAHRLQLALQRALHFVLLVRLVTVRQGRSLNSGGLYDLQNFSGNALIDSFAAETDAPRLTLVEPGTVASIACHIVHATGVMNRGLCGAAATA